MSKPAKRWLPLLAVAALLPLAACAQAQPQYLAYDNAYESHAQWNEHEQWREHEQSGEHEHRWHPEQHPYYVHAMSDLRLARAYLAHPGNDAVSDDERVALHAIDQALREMWRAALNDGKNPDWQAPIDARLHGADRFHMAVQLLNKARQDASHDESDPWVRDLQGRILHHIDEAQRATWHAYNDAQHSMAPPPNVGILQPGPYRWHPEEHPYYLHAMSDLREARAYLARPGNHREENGEMRAIGEIDEALREMWHASIRDGKDPRWQMPVDTNVHGPDRFHRALELLGKAQSDTSHNESEPWLRDLQGRILQHIVAAKAATMQAYNAALQ
jgi:hypothetical protein